MGGPAWNPPPYGYGPPPAPRRPIRWWTVILGALTPIVVFGAVNLFAGLFAADREDDVGPNVIFIYLPVALAMLSLLTLVAGILFIVKGDRGYGIGLLSGWALGLIVGAGVCFTALTAASGQT
jgi:hypothetical protein